MNAGTARPLLLGLEGPEARVSARVATRLIEPLLPWLAAQRDAAYAAGTALDAELVATVYAIEVLADIAGTSDNGSPSTPDDRPPSSVVGNLPPDVATSVHDHPMTTKAAAERLGCSQRNVRGLAARGALGGERLGHAWIFQTADVNRLAAERKQR